jgi:hypothetical protein
MTKNDLLKISISVEELALLFSLIQEAEAGKSILYSTFGNISAASAEEKMTTASHSLLARGYARITEKGAVALDKDIELMVYPLVLFRNILQVTINENGGSGPEIINIYLGKKDTFTSLRVKLGVVYELTHGKPEELPALINKWITLPAELDFDKELSGKEYRMSMLLYTQIADMDMKESAMKLEEIGLPPIIARKMAEDIISPIKRGTVLLTEMNSENFRQKNTEEGGEGFFYLLGKNSGWILSFSHADDQAIARILPGSPAVALEKIQTLVNSKK